MVTVTVPVTVKVTVAVTVTVKVTVTLTKALFFFEKSVAGALSNGAWLAWSARYPRYHTIVGRELMLDRMLQATNAQRPRQTRRIVTFF